MLAKFRPRLTYANVVSSACLFIVLGGSAYATHWGQHLVRTQDIASNAVTNPKLAPNAVGTGKVADNNLLANDIKPESIGGGRIAPDSLKSADVAELTGADVTADSLKSADVAELTGADVTDDSLGGDDVDESSLQDVDARTLDGRFGGEYARRASDSHGFNLNWRVNSLFTTGGGSDADFGQIKVVPTGTAGQFKICEDVPLTPQPWPYVVYVNGTRSTGSINDNVGTGTDVAICSGLFDAGVGGDIQIYVNSSVILGAHNPGVTANSENYFLYGFSH